MFTYVDRSAFNRTDLGGINSDHYTGDITYTPVTEEQWWTVALDGVSRECFSFWCVCFPMPTPLSIVFL